jgi:hypothetical protein
MHKQILLRAYYLWDRTNKYKNTNLIGKTKSLFWFESIDKIESFMLRN